MNTFIKYDFFAPHWLWLLIVVPVLFVFLWYKENNRKGDWKYTSLIGEQKKLETWYIPLIRKLLIVNYCIVACLLIVAMAKPYDWTERQDMNHQYKDGIDIVLTIDISRSMLATDFFPSRIEVAKKVAKDFVDARTNDRIGLVAYAGQAFTACPTTTDYRTLKQQIDALNCEINIEPGTAIGIGLGTAVTRLRNDSIRSKVIILITDGSNNMGNISPIEAAELAKAKNVKVYTIGMGRQIHTTNQQQNYSSFANIEPELDETTLMEIAQRTNGMYFNASNENGLRKIYSEIDKMEKRIIIDTYFQGNPPANPHKVLSLALLLLMIAWIVPNLLFWKND